MELDELKILLNDKMEQQVVTTKSPADILMLQGKKTESVIGKIKRSLVIELIASVIFTGICAVFAFYGSYDSLRMYFGIFTIVFALFILVLYLLLNKTNNLSKADLPVKTNLQSIVRLVREYIKRYFQLTLAFIPVSFIIAFMLGFNEAKLNSSNGENPFMPAFLDTPLKISALIAYVLVFSVAMYYFTKWYLKKLYGNYVQQLEGLIKELEENK